MKSKEIKLCGTDSWGICGLFIVTWAIMFLIAFSCGCS